MKFRSGVQHALIDGSIDGAGRPKPVPRAATPCAAVPPAPGRRLHAAPAGALPRDMRSPRGRKKPAGTALVGIAAAAALIGCSSVPSSSWVIQPNYRLEGSGPGTAQGHLALAQQYEGENRVAQALDAFRRAALAAPDDAGVHNALGMALARHGHGAQAVTALRRAVALKPDSAPLLNNLGYALLLDGRRDDARAMFRLTLAVDPNHTVAARNLASVDVPQTATASSNVPPPAGAVTSLAVDPLVMESRATPNVSAAPTAPTVTASVAVSESASAPGARRDQADELPAASFHRTSTLSSLQGVSVEIVNGNGIRGAAARLQGWLNQQGLPIARLANLPPYSTPRTQVLYRTGKAEEARAVAAFMPAGTQVGLAAQGISRSDVRVVIGHDTNPAAACQRKPCGPVVRVAESNALGPSTAPGETLRQR